MTKTSRGVRNNNPGNIDRNKTKWQGMAKDQSGDARFVVFVSPQFGIRALAKTLMTYQSQHKLRTVKAIINRWAPPVENNTTAYVDAVADAVGVNASAPVDVDTMEMMLPLVKAIIAHENGYSPYSDTVIREGLNLAGVSDAKPKPLVKQMPFVAQTVTGLSVAGAGVAHFEEPVKAIANHLAPYAMVPVVERAQHVLLAVAAVFATVGLVSMMLKQRYA